MDMLINAFLGEYHRYRMLAEKAVEQVCEEEFCRVFGDASIAMYMEHVGSNLTSRFTDFLTSDGEKPDRDREHEFDLAHITREHSLHSWHLGWLRLEEALEKLSDEDLARIITIRKIELGVSEALTRSLSHTSYHVGQIVLLAKMQRGNEWKPLSIPRGLSESYNRNPTHEKTGIQV